MRKYGIIGLAVHLIGFALGFVGEGLILMGTISIESGAAALEPVGDLLYGLGLVTVVAVAAKANVPMKYLLISGTAIGIGLFCKSAVHEIHIASGMGFGLEHLRHIGIGAILITLSVVALAVLALRYNGSREHQKKKENRGGGWRDTLK